MSGASFARISSTRSAKFFERVHGLGILLISLGPGAHMREAQLLEGAIDRIVRHRESELLIQSHDEIARPPAHHAMDRRDRTLIYDSGEKGLAPGVELGRHSRRRDIDETVRSLLVEPDHPVPQRLTNPCHRSWPPLPARRRRARPQSLTAVAPAQHLSLAGQTGEPRRPYSPSAPQWPGPWQTPSVCHLESCRDRFGNP